MSSGHLSPPEYEERAAKAVAAKTFGELDELTDDLPVTQLTTAGVATSRRVTTPSAGVDVITSRVAIMTVQNSRVRSRWGNTSTRSP